MGDRPELSIVFPVYNDARTVETVTLKALEVGAALSNRFEVVIVNDGSPDESGEIADRLAERHPNVTVLHHEINRGYGAALKGGLAAASGEWICLTDGDDEYDLFDLFKMWRLREHYELIITFRYVRRYSSSRIVTSRIYNSVLRRLFDIRYRDISTGLRLVRASVVAELELEANSPFIGAEIAIKTTLKGFPVGEVGIQTFPRDFGSGATTSPRNILLTINDMLAARRSIFGCDYDLPPGGGRACGTRAAIIDLVTDASLSPTSPTRSARQPEVDSTDPALSGRSALGDQGSGGD